MTTKFVNADFEKLLPESFVELSLNSVDAQSRYQKKISDLWLKTVVNADFDELEIDSGSMVSNEIFDFQFKPSTETLIFSGGSSQVEPVFESADYRRLKKVESNKSSASIVQWLTLESGTTIAVFSPKKDLLIGITGPVELSSQSMMLRSEAQSTASGITVIQNLLLCYAWCSDSYDFVFGNLAWFHHCARVHASHSSFGHGH